MINHIIRVSYPAGEYPIYIGDQLLQDEELLRRHLVGTQVLVVTNHLLEHYLTSITHALRDYQCNTLMLPDGESHKTLDQWSFILDTLAMHHHHRDTTLIALGGGLVGDVTGFAAACYHRGVAFIQIPTSLLAQVDASIGGKTGINHPKGKNLIGAFHQPSAVFIDTETLKTLPDREFYAGIAEIIKVALIKDFEFFNWLEDNMHDLLARKTEVVMHAIKQACLIKRDIVGKDEKERGERILLNFGHTLGHALEQTLHFRDWLHGEAVAWGMLQATELSVKLGNLSRSQAQRIYHLIEQAQLLKKFPSDITKEQLMNAMRSDKKILANQMRFIILERIGQGKIIDKIPVEEILYSLNFSYEFFNHATTT